MGKLLTVSRNDLWKAAEVKITSYAAEIHPKVPDTLTSCIDSIQFSTGSTRSSEGSDTISQAPRSTLETQQCTAPILFVMPVSPGKGWDNCLMQERGELLE